MIKLKDILLESNPPNLLIPRRIEGRIEKYAQAVVQKYIKDGSKGDLDLRGLKLTKLPSNLKNVSVGGNFICISNNLTSLANAPSSVGGTFRCDDNKLTSLAGAPSSVGGTFFCDDNKLTSLAGAPSSVGRGFYCSSNKLTSLVGAPSSVGGGFYCSHNNLTSLVGAPKKVIGNFSCNHNAIKFTIEQVRAVCDVDGRIFV